MVNYCIPKLPDELANDYLHDLTCDKIAYYLATGLNDKANSLSPGLVVVRSTRSYDTSNVGAQEFPLLKVFRTSDQFKVKETMSVSTIVATYSLMLPAQDNLVPFLRFISYNINKLLIDAKLRIGIFVIEESKFAEYRVISSEINQPVYSYLKFNFRIKD